MAAAGTMAVSDASVFLLTEVRVLPCDIPAAMSWCRRRGFSAISGPAAPSAHGGMPPGGVANVVKVELGLVPRTLSRTVRLAESSMCLRFVTLPLLSSILTLPTN